jgi:hypothetical protein
MTDEDFEMQMQRIMQESIELEEQNKIVRQVEEFEAREKAKREEEARQKAKNTSLSRSEFSRFSNNIDFENLDDLPAEFIAAQQQAEEEAKRRAEMELLREIEEYETREKAQTEKISVVSGSTTGVLSGQALQDFIASTAAQSTSSKVWTRDPGVKVSENNTNYVLRAENMPDSQKNGGQTKGLGQMIQSLEKDPNRTQIWAEKLEKTEKQMQQRKIVNSSPSVNTKEQQEKTQKELEALRVKRIQELEESKKKISQKKEEPVVQTVKQTINGFEVKDPAKK